MEKKHLDWMIKIVLINAGVSLGAGIIFFFICFFGGVGVKSPVFAVLILVLCLVLTAVNSIAGLKISTDKFDKLAVKFDMIAMGDLNENSKIGTGFVKSITKSVNNMIDGLRNILSKFKDSSENIMNLAENLSASTEQINASAEEISSTVQQIARGVEQQAERTVETSRIMENMSNSIQEVAQKSEEVLGVAKSAKEATENGMNAVKDTILKMEDIVNVTNKAKDSVEELKLYSEKIEEVVNTITEIADETNLLALNAAIEAARAGEAGRGFAVVADEVRKLAEGSARSAKEITRLVEDIHEKTDGVVKAIMVGVRETEEGKKVVTESGEVLKKIDDIVSRVVKLSGEITSLTKAQAQDTDRVVKAVEEIAAVAEETAAGTQQASASTQEQTASMEEIAAQAQELAQTAELLRGLMTKFNLEKKA